MSRRIAAAVTSLMLLGGALPAHAAPAGPTYVALGDSYAAGYGLPAPAVPTGEPACRQTSLDYPHRLAASLALDLTDVACSGAVTADISAPQPGTGVPAQLDAVTSAPDLVTITIGGNDLGFASIAQTCLAASPTGPLYGVRSTYDSCQEYFASDEGKALDPYARLADVQAKVGGAIAAVAEAAPRATIVVVGYPAIAPDVAHTPAGGCFLANALTPSVPAGGVTLASAFPFTDVDVPYLQELQKQLDTAIGAEAADAGVTYSTVYTDSLTHSGCAPAAQRWVEPVVPAGGGNNSLHPSLTGTQAMADALAPVVRSLRGLAPPVTPPVAAPVTTTPLPPSTLAPPVTTPPVAAVPIVVTAAGARSDTDALVVATPFGPQIAPLANTGPAPVGRLGGVAVALLLSGIAMVAGSRRRREQCVSVGQPGS